MPRSSSAGSARKSARTINEELWGTLKSPAIRLGAEYAPIAYSNAIEIEPGAERGRDRRAREGGGEGLNNQFPSR